MTPARLYTILEYNIKYTNQVMIYCKAHAVKLSRTSRVRQVQAKHSTSIQYSIILRVLYYNYIAWHLGKRY